MNFVKCITSAALLGVACLSAQSAQAGTLVYSRAGFDPYVSSVANIDGNGNIYGGLDAPSQDSASASYAGWASANAYADLTTGKVGVYAASTGDQYGTNGGATAHAIMGDTLTFDIAGANATTVTSITLQWLVHGFYEDIPTSNKGTGSFIAELQANSAAAALFNYSNQAPSSYSNNFTSGGWEFVGNDSYLLTATYDLLGANPILNLRARISANVVGNITANFVNTATFDFVLPENVTYTSQSGTFLTAPSAVPEAATWLMMILGFAAVGASLRAGTARVRFAA